MHWTLGRTVEVLSSIGCLSLWKLDSVLRGEAGGLCPEVMILYNGWGEFRVISWYTFIRKGQISAEFLESNAIEDKLLVADEFLHCKPYFAVFNIQPDLRLSQIQISQVASMTLRMNGGSRRTASMTKGTIPKIGNHPNQGRITRLTMNRLFCDFYLHKWKILCYTKSWHCAIPFVLQVPVRKKLILRKAA